MPNSKVSLESAITALREDLGAILSSQEGTLRFEVQAIELTLRTTVSGGTSAQGGVKWWLVSAGAEVNRSSEAVQEIKLSLAPRLLGPSPTTNILIDDE